MHAVSRFQLIAALAGLARLNLQFGEPPFRFALLFQQNSFLLKPLLRRFNRVANGRINFHLKPGREFVDFLAEAGPFLLSFSESRFALLPALLEFFLLLLVLLLKDTRFFFVFILGLLAL